MMPNFIGAEGFFWWTGVVEGREDPLKIGRVQVRIFGLHDELILDPVYSSGTGMPVESLPWAQPLMPVNNAAMNGIGESPTGLVEGSWVMGFSRDGRACQDLVVMGVIPGVPDVAPNLEQGFYDNKQTKDVSQRPKRPTDAAERYPKADYLGEADTNRLARVVSAGTVVQTKKDSVDKGVSTSGGSTWDEPETQFNATYPYNHVSESESGHIIERDDTPGAERTHDYHRSGTFEEVHPDGTKVSKIVKDNYEIVLGDDNIHVKGVCNITVDGSVNVQAASAILKTSGSTTVNASDVTVNAPNVAVNSSSMTVNSSSIDLNGKTRVSGKEVAVLGGATADTINISSSGQ